MPGLVFRCRSCFFDRCRCGSRVVNGRAFPFSLPRWECGFSASFSLLSEQIGSLLSHPFFPLSRFSTGCSRLLVFFSPGRQAGDPVVSLPSFVFGTGRKRFCFFFSVELKLRYCPLFFCWPRMEFFFFLPPQQMFAGLGGRCFLFFPTQAGFFFFPGRDNYHPPSLCWGLHHLLFLLANRNKKKDYTVPPLNMKPLAFSPQQQRITSSRTSFFFFYCLLVPLQRARARSSLNRAGNANFSQTSPSFFFLSRATPKRHTFALFFSSAPEPEPIAAPLPFSEPTRAAFSVSFLPRKTRDMAIDVVSPFFPVCR